MLFQCYRYFSFFRKCLEVYNLNTKNTSSFMYCNNDKGKLPKIPKKISKYRDSAIQCYLSRNAIQCYFDRNAIQCYFINNAIPMLFFDNAIQCYFNRNAIQCYFSCVPR